MSPTPSGRNHHVLGTNDDDEWSLDADDALFWNDDASFPFDSFGSSRATNDTTFQDTTTKHSPPLLEQQDDNLLHNSPSSSMYPFEPRFETSFASFTSTSVQEPPTTAPPTTATTTTNTSIPKLRSPPLHRPSIIRRQKISNPSADGDHRHDVPLLSTTWSDVSSSSSSSLFSNSVTYNSTASTTLYAPGGHLDASSSSSSSLWLDNDHSSYFVEPDGTVVALAYPIPDPLLLTAVRATTSIMLQGLPHGSTAAQVKPDLELSNRSSSNIERRKMAMVDLSCSSQEEYHPPIHEPREDDDDRTAISCVIEGEEEQQLIPTRSSSTKSATMFPAHRPEALQQRKLNNKSATTTTNNDSQPLQPVTTTNHATGANTTNSDVSQSKALRNQLPLQSRIMERNHNNVTYIPARFQHQGQSERCASPPPLQQQERMVAFSGSSKSESSSILTEYDAYSALQRDVAYRHAMAAGYLWQSLVGQHVRFPSKWWNGARSPAMGMDEEQPSSTSRNHHHHRWMYIASHRVQGHAFLNKLVPKRDCSGKLLLHIVVQDLVTWKPVQDIVIGCFHSNARGARRTPQAIVENEHCREVYMAVRKRCDEVSVVDCLLTDEGEALEHVARDSPLMGSRHQVTNLNLKAIFGDEPPRRTVFLLEHELHSKLIEAAAAAEQQQQVVPIQQPPALLLVNEFCFDPVVDI